MVGFLFGNAIAKTSNTFKLSLFCSDTDTELRRPQADRIVNNVLLQIGPHYNQFTVLVTVIKRRQFVVHIFVVLRIHLVNTVLFYIFLKMT